MQTIRKISPVSTGYTHSNTKEEPKKKDEPIPSIKFDDIFKEELRKLNKKEGE